MFSGWIKKCIDSKTYLKDQRGCFTHQVYGPIVRHRGQRHSRTCCERLATLGELIMRSASFASPWVLKVTLQTSSCPQLLFPSSEEMDHRIQEEMKFQRATDLLGTQLNVNILFWTIDTNTDTNKLRVIVFLWGTWDMTNKLHKWEVFTLLYMQASSQIWSLHKQLIY